MSDDKNPLEQAVDQAMDTFVYAPIGLLFDGPALFPKLVEKGRTQVQVARMMGQMAVQVGQSEAEKRVGKAQGQVRDSLVAVGLVPAPAKPAAEKAPAPEPAVAKSAETTPAKKTTAKKSPAKKSPAKKSTAKKTTAKKAPAKKSAARKPAKKLSASSLGIPDYDSLSASQVVSRLRGLAAADLDALKAYESATRARKTILNRITQLQRG
ncbi:hypothetical protein [Actinospongicola halichondriae]|uniref:hypothetical protein n=1 Tax=Actinospongicola halichondriae TaxID=3236844 RepID=UPI003D40357A